VLDPPDDDKSRDKHVVPQSGVLSDAGSIPAASTNTAPLAARNRQASTMSGYAPASESRGRAFLEFENLLAENFESSLCGLRSTIHGHLGSPVQITILAFSGGEWLYAPRPCDANGSGRNLAVPQEVTPRWTSLDNLPGQPLVWKVALRNLIAELTGNVDAI